MFSRYFSAKADETPKHGSDIHLEREALQKAVSEEADKIPKAGDNEIRRRLEALVAEGATLSAADYKTFLEITREPTLSPADSKPYLDQVRKLPQLRRSQPTIYRVTGTLLGASMWFWVSIHCWIGRGW